MTPEDAKKRLLFWKQYAARYTALAESKNGCLTRSESWYRDYCLSPYLALASTDYLSRRFVDHFHNNLRLNSEGKIGPRLDFADDSGLFGPLFSHLNLELQHRGGAASKTIYQATSEIGKYFLNNGPTGVRLFKNHPETLNNVIVKFSKRCHLERMIADGEVRVTPASNYANGSLVKAMQDLETMREFHIPAFKNVLRGESSIDVQGITGKIQDGFVKIVKECPNYVLWCACRDIDRRMPDDFNANAALIIKDPDAFARKFIRTAREKWPTGKWWFGPVSYYDPCSSAHHLTRPELIKHFSFSYQREWRMCFFPPDEKIPEEPFNIYLGNISDIAELVILED